MLWLDIINITYASLTIILSLVAVTLLIFSIASLFYPHRTKDKSTKYQIYGYVVMSINVILLELTYLIPACFPSIVLHLNFCIALGAIQHFVENLTMFFIIGMSIYLPLHISPNYGKCRCQNTRNIGRNIFFFWISVGTGYSLFFMVFGLCENLFGVDGNRCWIVSGPEGMDYMSYQWISYRALVLIVLAMTIICAILCSIQFKKRMKMYKCAYETQFIKDETGEMEIIYSLNRLNKTLLRQYVTLTIVCVIREFVSIISYRVLASGVPKSQQGVYYGLADIVYVVACFFYVGVFTRSFLVRFIYYTWDRINIHCCDNSDIISLGSYQDFEEKNTTDHDILMEKII